MVTARRFGPLPPVVLTTLIVLVVCYVVEGGALNFAPSFGEPLFRTLSLDATAVLHGEAWRVLTYGLLHDPRNPTHLLLNALMFYFFARDLELRFGPARFVAYLVGAVVAGGVSVVVGAAIGIASPMAIGFSGAVEACVVYWALTNRNAPVLFLFAIPMRGIHMLFIGLGMWVLDAVSQSGISAAAHFGGIVFAFVVYLFTARRNRVRLFFDELLVKLRLRRGPKLTVVPKGDRWVN